MSVFPVAVQDDPLDGTLVVAFGGRYMALREWEIQGVRAVTRADQEGLRQAILVEGLPVAGGPYVVEAERVVRVWHAPEANRVQ